MASKKKKPAAETARVSAADLHVKGLKMAGLSVSTILIIFVFIR